MLPEPGLAYGQIQQACSCRCGRPNRPGCRCYRCERVRRGCRWIAYRFHPVVGITAQRLGDCVGSQNIGIAIYLHKMPVVFSQERFNEIGHGVRSEVRRHISFWIIGLQRQRTLKARHRFSRLTLVPKDSAEVVVSQRVSWLEGYRVLKTRPGLNQLALGFEDSTKIVIKFGYSVVQLDRSVDQLKSSCVLASLISNDTK